MYLRLLCVMLCLPMCLLGQILPKEGKWVVMVDGGAGLREEVTRDTKITVELECGAGGVKEPIQCMIDFYAVRHTFSLEQDPEKDALVSSFLKACEMAAKEENYEQSVQLPGDKEIRVVAGKMYGQWLIMVQDEGKIGMFGAREAGRLRSALKEVCAGKRWYEGLLETGKVPQKTKEVHPPRGTGLLVHDTVGRVKTEGGMEVEVCVLGRDSRYGQDSYERSVSLHFGKDQGVDYSASLLESEAACLEDALKALKQGEDYHWGREVRSDNVLELVVDTDARCLRVKAGMAKGRSGTVRKGVLTLAQLEQVMKFRDKAKQRAEWYEVHEDLFFEKGMAFMHEKGTSVQVVLNPPQRDERNPGMGAISVVIDVWEKHQMSMVRCLNFKQEIQDLSQRGIEEFYAACDAAAAGKEYHVKVREENVEETVYESVQRYGAWLVRIRRGREMVAFLPIEKARLKHALAEAKIAQKWYAKLYGVYEIPEPTEEARPPQVNRVTVRYVHDGGNLMSLSRSVLGAFFGEAEVMVVGGKVEPRLRIRLGSVDVDGYLEDEDAERVLVEKLLEGRLALKARKDFGHDHQSKAGDSFTLEVGGIQNELELKYLRRAGRWSPVDEVVKSRFIEADLYKLAELVQDMKRREAWVRENLGLFYTVQGE
ncbi:hypothetical protein Rhal01_02186 [Rubritalea halochordaticola]|uniref:Uncharacterized protein n=1 Tax=Rubritalea halochordaticola TaxID=714537 RepID=A0ABP9V057_9BACT